jgi:hypothetical protein
LERRVLAGGHVGRDLGSERGDLGRDGWGDRLALVTVEQ